MFLRRLVQLASVSLLWTASALSRGKRLAAVRDPSRPGGHPRVCAISWARCSSVGRMARQAVQGFRPLFLTTRTGEAVEKNLLYPLFTWKSQQPGYSLAQFPSPDRAPIQRRGTAAGERSLRHLAVLFFPARRRSGEILPRPFSPSAGTLKNRLGRDRISFVLWPLYLQTEKKGRRGDAHAMADHQRLQRPRLQRLRALAPVRPATARR